MCLDGFVFMSVLVLELCWVRDVITYVIIWFQEWECGLQWSARIHHFENIVLSCVYFPLYIPPRLGQVRRAFRVESESALIWYIFRFVSRTWYPQGFAYICKIFTMITFPTHFHVCTYRGTCTQAAHMYNQHIKGMTTSRHRSLEERGGRKALYVYFAFNLSLFVMSLPLLLSLSETM